MRSTEEIFQFVKGFVKISGINIHLELAKMIAQVSHFEEDSLKLGHRVGRPQVEEIDAGVLLAPMVKGVIRRESDMRSENEIAVLVTEHEHPYLQAVGIPVCAVWGKCRCYSGGRARSYEWPVVIAIVCFPGAEAMLSHLIFSRAVISKGYFRCKKENGPK